MRKFVYEFSILIPITNNEEFAEKVSPPLYPTFWSILNPMRLITAGVVGKLANQGHFKESGRYRIEVTVEGMKYRSTLSRKV